VGRYNWVILDRLDALGRSQLQDLIQQSYAMVAAKAPGKSKPQTIGGKKAAKKKPAGWQGSKRLRLSVCARDPSFRLKNGSCG